MTPPLAGIRVLDFTQYLAGPFCTMQLADLGADVVKVERPDRGREFAGADGRDTYFFLSANRGKRAVALDYTRPEGRDLVLRLLPAFDVVVERSEERRVGKECTIQCRSRWSPYH